MSQLNHANPNDDKLNKQSDVQLASSSNNRDSLYINKLKKRKTVFSTIMLISIILVLSGFVILVIVSSDQNKSSTLLLRICSDIIKIGLITFIIFLILTINAHSNIKKALSTKSSIVYYSESMPQQSQKNSPGTAIASLICAIIPLAVLFYCLIISGGSGNENGSGAVWWIFAFYCWTLGLPLLIIWLVCGILGLKSPRRNMALASLATLPIGILVFVFILILLNAHY